MESKWSMIDALRALIPSGDDHDDKKIEKVIHHLEKSLADKYWATDSTLTEKGKKVFEQDKKAIKELGRLMMIPPMAPEVGVIRTYLDWLLDLPWSTQTEDNLDLIHAAKVLDEEHYGLPKAKERGLGEYLAKLHSP